MNENKVLPNWRSKRMSCRINGHDIKGECIWDGPEEFLIHMGTKKALISLDNKEITMLTVGSSHTDPDRILDLFPCPEKISQLLCQYEKQLKKDASIFREALVSGIEPVCICPVGSGLFYVTYHPDRGFHRQIIFDWALIEAYFDTHPEGERPDVPLTGYFSAFQYMMSDKLYRVFGDDLKNVLFGPIGKLP